MSDTGILDFLFGSSPTSVDIPDSTPVSFKSDPWSTTPDMGAYYGVDGVDTFDLNPLMSFPESNFNSMLFGSSPYIQQPTQDVNSNPLSGAWDWMTKTGMSKEPVLDANGKLVGWKSSGVSPLGLGIAALAGLAQYKGQKKAAAENTERYDLQKQWATEDRARNQRLLAQQDELSSPFTTQVVPRIYQPINNTSALTTGRLNRGTGQVFSPVFYDRSQQGVRIVPGTVSASTNPLAFAHGGLVSEYADGGKTETPEELIARMEREYGVRGDPVAVTQTKTTVEQAPQPKKKQGVLEYLRNIATGGLERRMKDTEGYANGGTVSDRYASGGQADTVPARLSGGEYIMDADVVSALGDGDTNAGARKLDQMRQNIRQQKRSAPVGKIPPKAKSPLAYMKGAK